MKIELFFRPHLYPEGDVRGMLEVARLADEAGLLSILFGDHVLIAPGTERWPGKSWPHGVETPWMEPLTTMASIAAVTEHVRLSQGILLSALRPAVLLAKTVATLDVLSNGRVDLAIGPGWQPEEYEASGYQWSERYRLMDEGIQLCRVLWGDQPAAGKGQNVSFDNAYVYPLPVQKRIPVLYGVTASPSNVKRIATLGDGWHPVQVTPDDLSAGVRLIKAAYREAGRDPETLHVRAPAHVFDDHGRLDVPGCVERAKAMLAAGGTTVCIGPDRRIDSVDELRDLIGRLGQASKES